MEKGAHTMTQEQAWELMRRAGALEKGHFLMKSGRHADLFLGNL